MITLLNGDCLELMKTIPDGSIDLVLTGSVTFSSGTVKKLTLDGGGNLTATGDITAFSDLRLKENIVIIDSPLEKINAMRGVYYTRKDNPGPRHVGVIAQEVEEVLPEVVLTDAATNKSVAYANMVALLIEGIKEQGKLHQL